MPKKLFSGKEKKKDNHGLPHGGGNEDGHSLPLATEKLPEETEIKK